MAQRQSASSPLTIPPPPHTHPLSPLRLYSHPNKNTHDLISTCLAYAVTTWLAAASAVDGGDAGVGVGAGAALPPPIGDPLLIDRFQVRDPVTSYEARVELERGSESAVAGRSGTTSLAGALLGGGRGGAGRSNFGWVVVEGAWNLISERGKAGWVASTDGARIDFGPMRFGPSPRLVLVYLQSYDQDGAIVAVPKPTVSTQVQQQRASAREQHFATAPLTGCLEGKAICAFSRREDGGDANATR